MAPAFARVSNNDLTLWLAGPQSSAARPMPDGRCPEPGGWNRFVVEGAIQNGFDALFTTATALIEDLSSATRDGKLRAALTSYTHPHVLVIDDVRV